MESVENISSSLEKNNNINTPISTLNQENQTNIENIKNNGYNDE